jgi:hypothetical protein
MATGSLQHMHRISLHCKAWYKERDKEKSLLAWREYLSLSLKIRPAAPVFHSNCRCLARGSSRPIGASLFPLLPSKYSNQQGTTLLH